MAEFVLVGVVAGIVICALVAIRRSRHDDPILAVLSFVSYLWARLWWRARIEGRIPIPEGQGAVIVCNHTSSVDPWFVYLASDRMVAWMIAAEYPRMRSLQWFFRRVSYIPVSRGGIDTAATKHAIRLARAGKLVGIFPEGRINLSQQLLLPGRPGPALVALKAKVPIVPCYIFGAPHSNSVPRTFFTPSKSRLVVGQPIDIEPYVAREDEEGILKELTLRLLTEIARLAGRPDFEPRLAGKKWRPTDQNGEENNHSPRNAGTTGA